MVAEFHFKDQLDPSNIKRITADNNFQNAYLVEQFIMDFEIFAHVKERLTDCVIKGGMAVPFHISDKSLHRLSVDVDLVTGTSRDEAISVMRDIGKKLQNELTIPEHHTPKNPGLGKQLPLLTYYCNYDSNFQERARIKLEIFYGNELEIKTKKVLAPAEIAGFTMDLPAVIYDHDALIGDKLATMPFNTIGIGPKRQRDVPKHIYDICCLLNTASGQISTSEIIHTFEKISHEEISYFRNERPTFEQVLDDIILFPDALLTVENDKLKLNASYRGRLSTFITELLGKTKYTEQAHLADILFVKIVCMLVRKHFKEKTDVGTIDKQINSIISERNRIMELALGAQNAELRKITTSHGKNSKHGRIIKNMSAVQAYLYDQILKLE